MKIVAKISFFYALFGIIAPVAMFIISFVLTKNHMMRKYWSKVVQYMLFASIKKIGEPDLSTQMYIVNHSSAFDISVVEIITPQPLAWVAKKELFEFPFLGLSLKLPKDIPLDRESKSGVIGLIKNAKDRVENGRVVTIFPEGTRSAKHKLLPFKAGTQMIVNKLGLRVQPIVLVGTGEIFDSKEREYHPGKVKAVFMDAFNPSKENKKWLKELRESMQEVYDRELADNTSHR